ncbi:beta-glucosidase [Terrimonas sp. NA20]|uniref:Beta-glucosidase n=1 Tax=Terrimonas ginsenosidimutans TaxID=2908004 RepID=A0ABS9KUZ8_9BACT|nr:glucoamylase family protein [Terrimonas ginsenosidimutans]MCG2616125.1 beta-glucosidase [Terrimonas ginsenosidimutans]
MDLANIKMCNKNTALLSLLFVSSLLSVRCGKSPGDTEPPTPPPAPFRVTATTLNNSNGTTFISVNPKNLRLSFAFNAPVDRATTASAFTLKDANAQSYTFDIGYDKSDSVVLITPSASIPFLSKFTSLVSANLRSKAGSILTTNVQIDFATSLDSSRKFPAISDDELLTKVQQQTFKYFWDFGHPVSGLARERSNGDNNLVTSGGSGFGILAIITGIERGFVTRAEGFARMQKIVAFLKNTAQTFHGAYPHWLNGTTGAVIPFSANDNGADLVETSYLIQGLLTARQYFTAGGAEATLRDDINVIWNRVEWSWFRKETAENQLYWHWSPDKTWQLNLPIRGWNECLITYVLAASSTSHGIPKTVYETGWARNGSMKNGKTFYGIQLPLGPDLGGPMFLSQYSFLGINPNGLSDVYADYAVQTKNHAQINFSYCVTNPKKFYGYSDSVWGLTASDIQGGYKASSPSDDAGFIAPTAALASFPYTPTESMKALKFFYYVLGDKLWKEYGFIDAFSLTNPWFASSFLAIDQGPIITMIENHRTGLLWNLFTSCPEVKTGMKNLGFTAPYL